MSVSVNSFTRMSQKEGSCIGEGSVGYFVTMAIGPGLRIRLPRDLRCALEHLFQSLEASLPEMRSRPGGRLHGAYLDL